MSGLIMTIVLIGVFGGGAAAASDRALEQAEAVGRELALHGCVLICGGMGGVMEAACRGASKAGGTTIGVLSGADPREANEFVQIRIATGMGEARNVIIALTSDALIAIDGEYGTLSEIAHALRNGKPVVGISTWAVSNQVIGDVPIFRTEDPAEAVQIAIGAARSQRGTSYAG